MKSINCSSLRKHLPLLSGWVNSRTQFNGTPAIEYDSEGFGK